MFPTTGGADPAMLPWLLGGMALGVIALIGLSIWLWRKPGLEGSQGRKCIAQMISRNR
jgi:hypothetical protein